MTRITYYSVRRNSWSNKAMGPWKEKAWTKAKNGAQMVKKRLARKPLEVIPYIVRIKIGSDNFSHKPYIRETR